MSRYYLNKMENEKKASRKRNYWETANTSEPEQEEPEEGEDENQEKEKQEDTLSPSGYFIMKSFFGF